VARHGNASRRPRHATPTAHRHESRHMPAAHSSTREVSTWRVLRGGAAPCDAQPKPAHAPAVPGKMEVQNCRRPAEMPPHRVVPCLTMPMPPEMCSRVVVGGGGGGGRRQGRHGGGAACGKQEGCPGAAVHPVHAMKRWGRPYMAYVAHTTSGARTTPLTFLTMPV